MLLLLHELLHAIEAGRRSRTWCQFSGTVLNISDLAFESVQDILRCKNADLRRTKAKILTREIAMDKLFLASESVAETLVAYQVKNTVARWFGRLRRSTDLRVEIEEFFGRMFEARAGELLKRFERRIPAETMATVTRRIWRRYRPAVVRKVLSTVEETIERFSETCIENPGTKKLYARLLDIGNLTGSRDLPMYLCRLALDVPLHHDIRRWVTGLPMQFNPERRLSVLIDTIEGVIERTKPRPSHVLGEWMRQSKRAEISYDVQREFDEMIAEESGLEFYDFFSPDAPRDIALNCRVKDLAIREDLGMQGQHEVRILFRRGLEAGLRGKNPDVLGFMQEWGFLPVAAYISNGQMRIRFSRRHDCGIWKIGWCLNYLKDQVVAGVDPDVLVNPASLRYFSLPRYERTELLEATRLAKKLASVSVTRSLWREFEHTSSQLGRTIQSTQK
jgi:hypothetical protein